MAGGCTSLSLGLFTGSVEVCVHIRRKKWWALWIFCHRCIRFWGYHNKVPLTGWHGTETYCLIVPEARDQNQSVSRAMHPLSPVGERSCLASSRSDCPRCSWACGNITPTFNGILTTCLYRVLPPCLSVPGSKFPLFIWTPVMLDKGPA